MSVGPSRLKLACLGDSTTSCVVLPAPLLVLRTCCPYCVDWTDSSLLLTMVGKVTRLSSSSSPYSAQKAWNLVKPGDELNDATFELLSN